MKQLYLKVDKHMVLPQTNYMLDLLEFVKLT